VRLFDRAIRIDDPETVRFRLRDPKIGIPDIRIKIRSLDIHSIPARARLVSIVHPRDRVLDGDIEEQCKVGL
jgi:hypothetical protein